MYLAILLVTILYLYTIRHSGKDLLEYGIVSAGFVLFPVTSMLIVVLFQGFYGYDETMWLLPMLVVPAYAVAEIKDVIPADSRKRFLMPIICIIIFLCGWMSFDKDGQTYLCEIDDATEYDTEFNEVYDIIIEDAGPAGAENSRKIVMAAPREIMERARIYDGRIGLAYGRDLWEVDLDYAFYEPITEEARDIAEKMEEPLPGYPSGLIKNLLKVGATYLVFDKENLSYGEDMQYPAEFSSRKYKYSRFSETRHYVIYHLG